MGVIILLIFFSMLVAGGFLAAFLWAVKSGQYDDSYTPSVRILFEDETLQSKNNNTVKIDTLKKNKNEKPDQSIPDGILHSVQDEI